MKENNQVFTVDELAVYLKVSKSTLYKLLSEGKVPGQKIGKHWRFSRSAINEWLKEPQRKQSQEAKSVNDLSQTRG